MQHYGWSDGSVSSWLWPLSVSGGGSEGKEQETTSEKEEESKGDGEVVLQVVDMSDSTKAREEYNKKFEEENNCKVEYTVLAGDQYGQTTINSSIKQIQHQTCLLFQVV